MVLLLSVLTGSLVGEVFACERSEQGWEIPDLEGLKAVLSKERKEEGKTYRHEAFIVNDTFFVSRLSCEGKVFTYAFDQNMDGKMDYWIFDGDGDGKFENLCYPNDEAIIPEWVKK